MSGHATHLAQLPKSLTFINFTQRQADSAALLLAFFTWLRCFMSLLVSSLFTPRLKIILPVFALILAGYACRKTNRLGPNASSELNRFVVYLALPALLFDIMATTPWHTLDQPAFIAAFGLGAGGIFLLTVMIRLKQSRHLADASLDGLNAAYPNAGSGRATRHFAWNGRWQCEDVGSARVR